MVNAIAADGVIEGIEDPRRRFCLGVQWHPEFRISRGDKKIFQALIAAARDATPPEKTHRPSPGGERIAKRMARAGLCSRREAEAWIAEGRVKVNGQKITAPRWWSGPRSRILVDGKPLPDKEKMRLWRYHKPRGLLTTAKDPQGRQTVFESCRGICRGVIPIGRLDLNSEGLLLLTNDGELARRLELPATGWVRRYRVRVNGRSSRRISPTAKRA